MEQNIQAIDGSKLIYTSGYFISSCLEAIPVVAQYASQQKIPICFNVADRVLLDFYPKEFNLLVGAADYLFATEAEA